LGQPGAARPALERAYQLDAELPAVCLNLGDLYHADQKLDKAVPLYQKIGRYDALTEAAERRLRYLIP
jgi:tetratricopeptide (TPR) repeat protein